MPAAAGSSRRVLIAECIHEVCSFNPVPTRYTDFFVNRGPTMLEYHRGIGSEINGALGVWAEAGQVAVVPTFSARGIASGGTIPRADFQRLLDEFTADLRAAGPVEGAYFALHGAMAAEQELDPEGCLLERAREILGEQIPIVASFDLHGILTDRMLQHLDASTVYHTYPHVDFADTGARAARLLLRLLRQEIRPVTAKVEIPALVRGDELITETGLFGQIIGKAKAIAAEPPGLAAGMFIGNPFTDVPELRSYSVVITDGDAAAASAAAMALAEEFWKDRQRMQARLQPVAEIVRQAMRETTGTVCVVDAADAPSSGAPGDGNAILQELLVAGYRGRVLLPIVDPEAVAAAFRAGIGEVVTTTVGGKLDPARSQPVPLTARVRLLSDGRFQSESFRQEWFADRTAVLQAENITLVATTRPVHLFDRSLFYAHGQDPRQFDLVVVKSPHCQRRMFADWCVRLLHADAPGATSANLPSLGHRVCRRPVFPLDSEVPFAPRAKIFSRDRR